MTSSNGNIFRVTGPLCGEFTGPGEFPTQRPVTRSFDVFFDLRLNKQMSNQSWGWWFETPSWSLWRQCNGFVISFFVLFVPCEDFVCKLFSPPFVSSIAKNVDKYWVYCIHILPSLTLDSVVTRECFLLYCLRSRWTVLCQWQDTLHI